MQTTSLSELLNRMDRYQVASTVEEQFKVRDLDDAIQTLERTVEVPWRLKKSTMRLFKDVLVYPLAADHDHLAYLDKPLTGNGDVQANLQFDDRARFKNTSLQEFYENPDYRNRLCEVWDRGTKQLGARFDDQEFTSSLVGGKVLSDYTASGDASNLATDFVVFKEDNSSIRFQITLNTGVANVVEIPGAFSDPDYIRKYYFRWIYLGGIPTSIDIRFGTDSLNYLTTNVTSQFSGQAFVANDWNLIAMDLSTATTVGTINSNSFNYDAVILHGAPSGLYYLDNSYLRDWVLMDYWYYSTFNVKTLAATQADREYFMDSTGVYSLDSSLVGDREWASVIVYDALMNTFSDKEDDRQYTNIQAKRQAAWDKLLETYPSMKPLITTSTLNFETDYNNEASFNRN